MASSPFPARRPDGPPDLSLHQRIMEEIEAKILSGDWPPGHRLPFEHELKDHYGCSRMTVNKVLTQLATKGLIERRRKAGSFVTRPRVQSAVLEINEIKAEVAALGLAYRFEIVFRHVREAGPRDHERLGSASPSPLLDLVCHHFADALPFCIEERIINLDAVPEARGEPFAALSPGSWLVGQVPWSSAEHRIRALSATPAIAAALRISEGSACLVIERRTFSATKPITFVRLIYPGQEHELVAHFTPARP